MNTLPKHGYACHICGEYYLTKNAADKCRQLPIEEVKFLVGNQVIVDACKSTQQTGTVVGTKFIAGFSGGKHFASYTVELSDKSLVLRNARSLKMCTPMPHPNKQEILDGIAAGREWEFRPIGYILWTSPASFQKFPTWVTGYEYRLKPVANPHPNRAEVEAGIAAGRTWECRYKAGVVPFNTSWEGPFADCPEWADHLDYRLTSEPEYVPLAPEDVPPGSVIRRKGQTDEHGKPQHWHWRFISYVTGIGPVCADRRYNYWQELFTDYEINLSLPLTGKWDANAWEPCKKIKQ